MTLTSINILKSELVGKRARVAGMVTYEMIEDIWPDAGLEGIRIQFLGGLMQPILLIQPIDLEDKNGQGNDDSQH